MNQDNGATGMRTSNIIYLLNNMLNIIRSRAVAVVRDGKDEQSGQENLI